MKEDIVSLAIRQAPSVYYSDWLSPVLCGKAHIAGFLESLIFRKPHKDGQLCYTATPCQVHSMLAVNAN